MSKQFVNRTIGDVHLSGCSCTVQYPAGSDEDGFLLYDHVDIHELEARTKRGELYACDICFSSHEEMKQYLEGLPEDFNPDGHEWFTFIRTVYGSEAYADNLEED